MSATPVRKCLTLGLLATFAFTACLPTAETKKRVKRDRSKTPTQATVKVDKGPATFAKAALPPFTPHPGKTGNASLDRFIALWNDLHDPKNGYFSPEGIPYHAVETLLVEAPDYGHETTSEAYSYWLWLEAAYGKVTGDWRPLEHAWKSMETYIIPSHEDQPTAGSYNYTHPAVFAPELDDPRQYPSPMVNGATPGWDPLWKELMAAYGEPYIYGMHWLIDVDNWYGFGRRGDGVSHPSYINTFQRGMQESVWETIPQPSWENFRWGGPNGYLDLFVKQGGSYAQQWKYTNAPDADARAVQALYWAKLWADEKGGSPIVDALVPKAAKMGDFLRYAFFDKYFKQMGCTSPECPTGKGRDSAHYLISWYYAWGGSTELSGGWSWRIGSSTSHQGYQNPFAAHVLGNVEAFKPKSENAQKDWKISLERQLEVLRFLQSADGAIAGGVTNSYRGRYAEPPRGWPSFYGMAYEEKPVWEDPPSNQWFGFQVWGIERTAALYWLTGDERAKVLLDRWVPWAMANTRLVGKDSYEVPSTLIWSGQPSGNWNDKAQNWKANDKAFNADLRVTVKDFTQDVGVTGTYARTLLYYGQKSGQHDVSALAHALLDRMWSTYRTDRGVSSPEVRGDYVRFKDPVYVPNDYQGKMPAGDPVDSSSTFIGLRSRYRQDPDWPKVEKLLAGGPAPEMKYHRFWAQIDIALSNATVAWLYPDGMPKKAALGKAAKAVKPGKPGKKAKN